MVEEVQKLLGNLLIESLASTEWPLGNLADQTAGVFRAC